MNIHEKINYVEFPAKDIQATKAFFTAAFKWSFMDYGPDYAAFSNEGLDGGFFKSDFTTSTATGSALIVFYSKDLLKRNPRSKPPVGQSPIQYSRSRAGAVFILTIQMEMNTPCGQMPRVSTKRFDRNHRSSMERGRACDRANCDR